MEKIIGGLNLYIRKILYKTKAELEPNPYLNMLCYEAKKWLANYDHEAWHRDGLEYSIQFFLEALEEDEDDYEIILIMFIILSMILDDIDKYDIEYLYLIATTFSIEDIFPLQYKDFLSMFLYPPISSKIQEFKGEDQIYILSTILDHTPYEDIRKGIYDEAIRILSVFINRPLSPLFLDDFSLPNIYITLKTNLEDPKYELFFNDSDHKRLELILELEGLLSSNLKEDYVKRILKIEQMCKKDKTLAIKKMLKLTLDYWAFMARGIGVIDRRDLRTHKKEM